MPSIEEQVAALNQAVASIFSLLEAIVARQDDADKRQAELAALCRQSMLASSEQCEHALGLAQKAVDAGRELAPIVKSLAAAGAELTDRVSRNESGFTSYTEWTPDSDEE